MDGRHGHGNTVGKNSSASAGKDADGRQVAGASGVDPGALGPDGRGAARLGGGERADADRPDRRADLVRHEPRLAHALHRISIRTMRARSGQTLTQAQIPFEASPDGAGILVPAAELDKARLATAAKGGVKSGRLGFEIFDKPNWVGSEFDEQVNYQRALEGELEHTVGSLSDVAVSARASGAAARFTFSRPGAAGQGVGGAQAAATHAGRRRAGGDSQSRRLGGRRADSGSRGAGGRVGQPAAWARRHRKQCN